MIVEMEPVPERGSSCAMLPEQIPEEKGHGWVVSQWILGWQCGLEMVLGWKVSGSLGVRDTSSGDQ